MKRFPLKPKKEISLGTRVSFDHNGMEFYGTVIECDGYRNYKVETELWMGEKALEPIFDTVRLLEDVDKHKIGEEAKLLSNVRESYLLRFDDGSEEWVLSDEFEFLTVNGKKI